MNCFLRIVMTLVLMVLSSHYAVAYHNISPYAWCGGNPIKFVDPNGNAQVSTTVRKNYPKVSAYIDNLIDVWNEKPQSFRDSFFKHSGLKQLSTMNILKKNSGPMIGVKPMEKDNGITIQIIETTTTRIKIGNKVKIRTTKTIVNTEDENGNNICIDEEIAKKYESNQLTEEEKNQVELLLESTIFHEFTHFGNAMSSGTSNGRYKESGKSFEIDVYGKDINP